MAQNANTGQALNTILIVGVCFAGYKLLQGLGFIDDQNEITKQNQIDTVVKNEANQSAATVRGTLSAAELKLIADSIYEDLRYSSWSDEKDAAVNEVIKVKNNTDWLNLIVAFGTRQNYYFGVPWGNKQSLVEFLQSNLSSAQIKGINFYFEKYTDIKYRLVA